MRVPSIGTKFVPTSCTSVCSFKKVEWDTHTHTHTACPVNKEVKYAEIEIEGDGKEEKVEENRR